MGVASQSGSASDDAKGATTQAANYFNLIRNVAKKVALDGPSFDSNVMEGVDSEKEVTPRGLFLLHQLRLEVFAELLEEEDVETMAFSPAPVNSESVPWLFSVAHNEIRGMQPDGFSVPLCFVKLDRTQDIVVEPFGENELVKGSLVNNDACFQFITSIDEAKAPGVGFNNGVPSGSNFRDCKVYVARVVEHVVASSCKDTIKFSLTYFNNDNLFVVAYAVSDRVMMPTHFFLGRWSDEGAYASVKAVLKQSISTRLLLFAKMCSVRSFAVDLPSHPGSLTAGFCGAGRDGVVLAGTKNDDTRVAVKTMVSNPALRAEAAFWTEKAKAALPAFAVTPSSPLLSYKDLDWLEFGEVGQLKTEIKSETVFKLLLALHLKGVTHGDPRTANVVHLRSGDFKFVDFQKARLIENGNADNANRVRRDLEIAIDSCHPGVVVPAKLLENYCAAILKVRQGKAPFVDSEQTELDNVYQSHSLLMLQLL
jgi:hypothetical protein